MPEYRLGELFCGPGGIAWGAVTAETENPDYRIVHQWATDYDRDTCDTYTHNICPDAADSVHCGDIRELDLNGLGEIDALAFGFPCNDYSVVGEQRGMAGVFGPLYAFGIEALRIYRPMWFLAENVGGLKNADDGRAFAQILDDMRQVIPKDDADRDALGYVITPHLYKFEEYGVPQARHRIIIVGIRNDIDNITFHVPSPAPYRQKTCREAIEEPPIPKNALNNELTNQSEVVIRRLEHINPGENAFTANLPEELQLNVKGAKISQIYKRLDPNKPAYTVTGSGGGGTHIYHWEHPRALTNRERARLQTFPDTYEFKGSKESVRKQIGMAVPCDGAKVIFEAVLKTLAGIDYEWIEANINEKEIISMPKKGDSFTVEIKPSHLGWGTYRRTDTRDPIYGEGYIKIPLKNARDFQIFNSNYSGANTHYSCLALNGKFNGTLLAQGCGNAGDVYAKQFAELGNLKGIGDWYKSVHAQVGGRVKVVFTSPTSLTIEYL